MNPLPIQPAKIHCPPDRSDTLSRPRLNTWLDRAATGRLGLIVAEAGFGKTTLLGDWARHSRRLTCWYRLESDDRDWLTFIRHLVASGRELHPDFAPATFAMLVALGTGGPTQRDLVASIAREMAEFAMASERGLTLIIDDYHLVDGFAETEPIVRAILDRTGPGFSVLIATRSMPTLPLSRIRARGGVMALGGRDLRFDVAETSSLFRDAYQHPLEEDLVSDLCERTEGWAALLTLIRTRLADRADPRDVVSELATSHGDIYDYLAEEVLASLPDDLTRFLTRVSALTTVDPAAAAIADGRPPAAATAAIRESERLGLLSRPDRASPHAFHPLVREYLAARLEAEIGADGLKALHRSLTDGLVSSPWHTRAWHLLLAGDKDECEAAVNGALEEILAVGDFDRVKRFLDSDAGDPLRPQALILRSKLEFIRGDLVRSVHWARAAVEKAADGPLVGMCLLNLASTLGLCGISAEAEAIYEEALSHELNPKQRFVAQANLALARASQEGDLVATADSFLSLAEEQERSELKRYAGIARLNLAGVLLWTGDAVGALREATRAETLLGGRRTNSVERVSATVTTGVALAQLGRLREARQIVEGAVLQSTVLTQAEISLETMRFELEFGSAERASVAYGRIDPAQYSRSHQGLFHLLAGELALRLGDIATARDHAARLERDRCADAAGKLRTQLLRARVALRSGSLTAEEDVQEAARIAEAQDSPRGKYLTRLLAVLAGGKSVDAAVGSGDDADAYCWSLLAEEITDQLDRLSPGALDRVRREAALRPDRWRTALRLAIESEGPASSAAASLLAEIGEWDDGAWLRSLAARRKPLNPYALSITQRLAKPVRILDLGVVEVAMGRPPVPRPLRRKVLALLCFLSTRPRMAASREEAIEALWADLGPEAGANSLHQAIYFMRRVFEPDFREGTSANYILVDGDTVSLNTELVDSSSRRCWQLLAALRGGDRGVIEELLILYGGRYALTFAYDEWAEAYRENLHAAVLAAVEAEMEQSRREGDFDRAIRLGHAMIAVDPQADAIELELLRSYKRSGRHAAAAEQYAHYASYLRQELGDEPPSFDDI